MAKFLVAYRLFAPDRNHDGLIGHLTSYGTYSHSLDGVWLLVTGRSAAEIRDGVLRHLDARDALLVVELTGAVTGHGLRAATTEWIRKSLHA